MIWMIGIGASAGACVRYFLTNLIKRKTRINFPLATLFLNLSGAFVLGTLVGMKINNNIYSIIGTGFLGGYTTFSTFNTELFAMIHDKNLSGSLLYGIISYLIGITFAFIGFALGTYFTS
ncbi:fluoride efflux transporter CrcB [Ligilactobacillus sp. LYQ135]